MHSLYQSIAAILSRERTTNFTFGTTAICCLLIDRAFLHLLQRFYLVQIANPDQVKSRLTTVSGVKNASLSYHLPMRFADD